MGLNLWRGVLSVDLSGSNSQEVCMLQVKDEMRNGRVYNGTTSMFGITVNGVHYLVKKAKGSSLSVFSEYIASKFMCELGIPCQKVELGIYNGAYVSVIKDLTLGGALTLHSFADTQQSSEDTDLSAKEYTYTDVQYLLTQHTKLTPERKKEALIRFWDMFIIDAILANMDRHSGNWGYLSDGLSMRLAPVYDNNACLFPSVSQMMHLYASAETRRGFLWERVYKFPASMFKMKRSDETRKTNFAEMFADLRVSKDFAVRVKYYRASYTAARIFSTIQGIAATLPLSAEYKRFYIEIVTLRYMCIVLRVDFNVAYAEVERWLSV